MAAIKTTVDDLKKIVSYRDTGELIWIEPTSNRVKVGDVVGWESSNGYIRCRILGKETGVHRFIWFFHKGVWPEEDIDHINGNRSDNRIDNLREATRSQNNMNYLKPKDNTSGYRGVYLNKDSGKYYWQVVYKGVTYSGSPYADPLLASLDRDEKAKRLVGEFVHKPTERDYCSGKWTRARFNSFIKSMLRRGSMRWLPKSECKKAARFKEKLPNAKGRMVFHSVCASCNKVYPETTCAVDHINPVVAATGFTTWDEVINRMFCEVEGLQVLCKTCHDAKTQIEKEERKRYVV